MAACIRKQLSKLSLVPKYTATLAFVRGSRYDKNFVPNITDHDEILTPLAEDDERRFKRIKAALTDDSTFADSHPEVLYFTNLLIKQGKKEAARGVVRKTFEQIKRIQIEKYHKAEDADKKAEIMLDPLTIFLKAVQNARPELHTIKVVKAGTIYKVPVPCEDKRQRFYAMKWAIESGRERDKRKLKLYHKMAADFIDAYNHEGNIIAKKQEMYRLCELNKMYATLVVRR